MADDRDILRHCGDMGEGDDWVKRLERANLELDILKEDALANAQALVDADIPQKYRVKLAEALDGSLKAQRV
jgi:hypothetical protein